MSNAAELHAWLNGTPTGGPEGDGRYPLTFADGETYLVYSPAAQALNPSVSEEPVEVFANTASAAAGQATQAADVAVQARTDAASYAGSAQTSATEALGYRNTASTHATTATNKASEAASSATAAAGSASTASAANTDAQSAKTAAETASTKAQDWADKEEDAPVETSKFSARHWALKAAASAASLATLAWDMVQNKPATATRWPSWTEVTGKPTSATRWPAWGEVTGKPSTFAPSSHTHTIANVTGLQSALDSVPQGTVTSVAGGNGLSGTVTSSGSISLGTPGTLSGSTTNAVQTSSHTHALSTNLSAWDGVTVASKADSARTITAGTGLNGGGNLSANRTFSIDTTVVGRIDTGNYAPTGNYDTFPIGSRGYTVANASNPNSPGTNLFLETVGGYGANDDRQFAWPHRTNGQFRFRCQTGATYGPWKEIWTSDTFDPATKADINHSNDFASPQWTNVGTGSVGWGLKSGGTPWGGLSTQTTSGMIMLHAEGGSIGIRPNGRTTTAGQLLIEANGNVTAAGNLNVSGTELRVGGSRAVEGFNDWLRLNEGNHFTSGTLARGTFRAYSALQLYEAGSEFLRANNNNTTLVRQPRMFVQSGDPGSNASTGDLWIW